LCHFGKQFFYIHLFTADTADKFLLATDIIA